jgi:hypothetical protein
VVSNCFYGPFPLINIKKMNQCEPKIFPIKWNINILFVFYLCAIQGSINSVGSSLLDELKDRILSLIFIGRVLI